MVTPTMRCSTSVTERSGSLPMSSATIESTISSESCLIFWAFCSAARWPVTITVVTSDGSAGLAGLAPFADEAAAAGAGGVCASATPLHSNATCAAATDNAVL